MNILIDLTSLADNFSGIERYAASLSYEMIKNTSNNYILVFKDHVHELFFSSVKNSNVEILVLKKCSKLIFNQIRLPLAISKIKADVYVFLAFPVPIFLFKKNMISTIHDICCWDCPETMNRLSKWYFRISHIIAMKKCKAIITISKFSKERIIKRLNYKNDKILLIYSGVDKKFLEFKKDNKLTKKINNKYHIPKNYILSLSTLEPRKNLKLLIEAYTELILKKEIDIPLVLAGRRGWKMDEVLGNIHENIKENILFTGFIDDDDLPTVYGNAELFVFPSLYEGFGIPPLEALACGTKVLSSDATSLPEVLGKSAYYFKNNDKADLIRTLKTCLENNEEQKRNINFNWDTEAQKLNKYINEIVSK